MAVNGSTNIGFDFTQLNKMDGNSASSSGTGSANGADLSSQFELELAQLQSDSFGSLMGAVFGADSVSPATSLASQQSAQNILNPLSALAGTPTGNGLSATGLNLALSDPQSAYNMMTTINNSDVQFKAQYAELSQMGSSVNTMQQAGQSLAGIDGSTSNDSIQTQLQAFTDQYNAWVSRYNDDMKTGGLLANTQAAEVSRFELEQNVENVFNGAKDGVRGLYDLGLSIDPNTKLATLDTSKLDAILASNKTGVVDAIQEFSANFTKSAAMLNSADNFIPNQLGNLSQAISYIANNEQSLQAEFGTGASATPTGQTAKALAAYNLMTQKNS